MMRKTSIFLACSMSLLAACGTDRDNSGVLPDGGTRPDMATTTADGGSTGSDAGTVEPGEWVDPNCVDGQYTEAALPVTANIGDLTSSYSSAGAEDFITDVLARRFPDGTVLVENGRMSTTIGDCVDYFVSDRSSANAIISQMSTITHECGHFYDLEESTGRNNFYFIAGDITFTCSNGDTTDRFGNTFARSLIRDDEYSALRRPCVGDETNGCDYYAKIYLDGDPTDSNFDSGDQGFNFLMEEAVQYVNSIATGYAFEEELTSGGRRISERDGILTFLWYIERYLKLARTEHADAYAFILGDECWRELILTVWGRAWLYLGLTEDSSGLGINDDLLEGFVSDPDLLAEIERVREAQGCGQ